MAPARPPKRREARAHPPSLGRQHARYGLGGSVVMRDGPSPASEAKRGTRSPALSSFALSGFDQVFAARASSLQYQYAFRIKCIANTAQQSDTRALDAPAAEQLPAW